MEEVSILALLVALVTVGIVYLLWANRRPACLPPGPPHIPFIGSILSMRGDVMPKLFAKFNNIYGPIFTVSFGNTHIVVLGDYPTIKEGLVTMGTKMAGRPSLYERVSEKMKRYSPIYPIMGIADSTYSEEWRHQRNTAMQILRSFGYGKHAIESTISEEALTLRDLLRNRDGLPTDPEKLISVSVSNVIGTLLYGRRHHHDDADFRKLSQMCGALVMALFRETAADFFPVLRLRASYHENLAVLKDTSQQVSEFNQRQIDERKAYLEETGYGEPRDFVEAYLKALKYPEESKLRENWLLPMLNDLFIAATETTTTTLQWALLRMAVHQDIQKKLQQAMDGVVGHETHVFRLADRERSRYTEATLMEVLRTHPILPMNMSQATTEDVMLRGYKLPKGTEFMCNIYAVLSSPEIWPEPEKFKPERFLGEDGELVQFEEWIPFAMGRRVCLGEQLARQELFLFFSTLVHSFHISLPEGSVTPSLDANDDRFWKSVPFDLIFTPRFE